MKSIVEKREGTLSNQNYVLPKGLEGLVHVSTFYIVISIICKIFLTIAALFVFTKAITMLSNGIKETHEKETETAKKEIEDCKRDYYANKCDGNEVHSIPGLSEECSKLRSCMNSKPKPVSTSESAVKYTATLINNFFDNLSTETVVKFSVAIIAVSIAIKFI